MLPESYTKIMVT